VALRNIERVLCAGTGIRTGKVLRTPGVRGSSGPRATTARLVGLAGPRKTGRIDPAVAFAMVETEVITPVAGTVYDRLPAPTDSWVHVVTPGLHSIGVPVSPSLTAFRGFRPVVCAELTCDLALAAAPGVRRRPPSSAVADDVLRPPTARRQLVATATA
jgi:hypothetical protein